LFSYSSKKPAKQEKKRLLQFHRDFPRVNTHNHAWVEPNKAVGPAAFSFMRQVNLMNYIKRLSIIELTALALWCIGLAGALLGQPWFRQYLYFFAWFPYLLFLDGRLVRLQGRSWFRRQPLKAAKMCFWSVTVWLVFEALNLVLGNWAYQGVTANPWLRWPGYALAFATVLPGVLLTSEVLAARGTFRGRSGRPISLEHWQAPSLLLGVAFLVLPLAYPHYVFPLIWGAFFFLLDPFCDLLGGESLIRKFLAGERQEHYCLLAAGLICGLWWESWNYLATSRWIYTLPVLNFWKVFEMPLLGYLGFPPFALECAVMYNFLKIFNNRVLCTPRQRVWAVLGQLIFWALMFAAMDAWTVKSFQL
jgi:hypothetical protein